MRPPTLRRRLIDIDDANSTDEGDDSDDETDSTDEGDDSDDETDSTDEGDDSDDETDSTDEGDDSDDESEEVPGFGAVVSLVALVAVALLATRRIDSG